MNMELGLKKKNKMAKILVHIKERDIESLIDVLELGGDHHITWSPVSNDEHLVQILLTPKEFEVLKYNYVDVESLPILPNNE